MSQSQEINTALNTMSKNLNINVRKKLEEFVNINKALDIADVLYTENGYNQFLSFLKTGKRFKLKVYSQDNRTIKEEVVDGEGNVVKTGNPYCKDMLVGMYSKRGFDENGLEYEYYVTEDFLKHLGVEVEEVELQKNKI